MCVYSLCVCVWSLCVCVAPVLIGEWSKLDRPGVLSILWFCHLWASKFWVYKPLLWISEMVLIWTQKVLLTLFLLMKLYSVKLILQQSAPLPSISKREVRKSGKKKHPIYCNEFILVLNVEVELKASVELFWRAGNDKFDSGINSRRIETPPPPTFPHWILPWNRGKLLDQISSLFKSTCTNRRTHVKYV